MVESTHEVTMQTKALINLTPKALIDYALQLNEGELAANEALVVKTGTRTGRSPKDRFIVRDQITETTVDWNTINQPVSPETFAQLWHQSLNYLNSKERNFISYLEVGAHEQYTIPVKVMTELAWHNLFAQILFIKPDQNKPNLNAAKQWTILSVPGFKTKGKEDGVHSDAAVILNFTARCVLICGTYYAGELKKAMFSVLNFILPAYDILPMHCAANAGKEGDTALFFGLSGTGKTTLSADPHRFLIGDDEHGWGEEGIFNFEGGCYAKCIDLSAEREPLIYHAIRYGTVIENVVLDPITKEPNYADASLTQNTRAAYPREFIRERVEENRGKQPNVVIFLTCDLFGVLPPVAKLTIEQAAYYFLSGYTALVGSTEVGQSANIQPTFSTCFGAPFFPRPPAIYAELLMKRLRHHPTDVYLINTGWSGGAHGQGGKRFSIPTTRSIVSAAINGQLNKAAYETLAGFNLQIPTQIEGVDSNLLHPRKNWLDTRAHDESAHLLIEKFIANFKRFNVSELIKKAGPSLASP